MNCPYCGSVNPEGATTCVSCGQPLAAAAPPPAPPAQPEAYAPPPAQPTYAAPPAPPAPVGYAQQPYAQPQVVASVPVKNHLVMAILATLFCCLPFGVVGIVFASQVNGKLAVGDYAGAQRASKAALVWSWVAIGAGIVAGIAYGLIVALGVVSEMGSF